MRHLEIFEWSPDKDVWWFKFISAQWFYGFSQDISNSIHHPSEELIQEQDCTIKIQVPQYQKNISANFNFDGWWLVVCNPEISNEMEGNLMKDLQFMRVWRINKKMEHAIFLIHKVNKHFPTY